MAGMRTKSDTLVRVPRLLPILVELRWLGLELATE